MGRPIYIGINGFGDIGMAVVRAAEEYKGLIEIVAINNRSPPASKAYLLERDTTYRKFPGEVRVEGNDIIVNGRKIRGYTGQVPSEVPWGDSGVDVVIEATGQFPRDRKALEGHLNAGARYVIVSTGSKITDKTIIHGVNNKEYGGERIIASGSCTTNCLVPLVYVLDGEFGIYSGTFTTTHAFTASQSLVDSVKSDRRRGRAAGYNIVPTSSGAEESIGAVFPHLDGLLVGSADRVPVIAGSLLHFNPRLQREVTVEEVNEAMKKASETDLKGTLEYLVDDAFASADVIGNRTPSVFDALSTQVIEKDRTSIAVAAWYDNIAATSHQILRLVQMIAAHESLSRSR